MGLRLLRGRFGCYSARYHLLYHAFVYVINLGLGLFLGSF